MNNKVVQVIATILLGFILSSGVAIIEESRSAISIANNKHIQAMDRMNIDLPYPPPAEGSEWVFSPSFTIVKTPIPKILRGLS